MKAIPTQNLIAVALIGALAFTPTIARAADPLPSWNGGKAKQSIMDLGVDRPLSDESRS